MSATRVKRSKRHALVLAVTCGVGVAALVGIALAPTQPQHTLPLTGFGSQSIVTPLPTPFPVAAPAHEHMVALPQDFPVSLPPQPSELVVLPHDVSHLSKTQAEADAERYAKKSGFPLPANLQFDVAVLARIQPVNREGTPVGVPGGLEWICMKHGPQFGPASAGPVLEDIPGYSASADTPTPYTAPPMGFLVVQINAFTGADISILTT